LPDFLNDGSVLLQLGRSSGHYGYAVTRYFRDWCVCNRHNTSDARQCFYTICYCPDRFKHIRYEQIIRLDRNNEILITAKDTASLVVELNAFIALRKQAID